MQSKSTPSIHVDQAVCRFAHLKNQSCFGFVFSALKPPHQLAIAAPINSALVFPSISDFVFKMHSEFMVIHLIKVVHNFVFFSQRPFGLQQTEHPKIRCLHGSLHIMRSGLPITIRHSMQIHQMVTQKKKNEWQTKPKQKPAKKIKCTHVHHCRARECVCACSSFQFNSHKIMLLATQRQTITNGLDSWINPFAGGWCYCYGMLFGCWNQWIFAYSP